MVTRAYKLEARSLIKDNSTVWTKKSLGCEVEKKRGKSNSQRKDITLFFISTCQLRLETNRTLGHDKHIIKSSKRGEKPQFSSSQLSYVLEAE